MPACNYCLVLLPLGNRHPVMTQQQRVEKALATLQENGWHWRGTGLYPSWHGGQDLESELINEPLEDFKWFQECIS